MEVINHEALLELKDVMEDDFALLIETFLTDAPERIEELKKIVSGGGVQAEMEKPAHTLKGSSSNIGAMKLSAVCAGLVDQIRAGSVADPQASIAAIEAELEVAKEVLLSYL